MATQTLINPFSMRCGTAVPAELYVSRPVEEATITERVLGSYFNNLSIVGLPKTGKSDYELSTTFNLLYAFQTYITKIYASTKSTFLYI